MGFSCPRCGPIAGLRVFPVRERTWQGADLPVSRDAGRAIGRFELLACNGCGLATFFAREIEELLTAPHAGAKREPGSCACGAEERLVVALTDATLDDGAYTYAAVAIEQVLNGHDSRGRAIYKQLVHGELVALVCVDCHRTTFRARTHVPEELGVPSGDPCRSCEGATRRFRAREESQQGTTDRSVTVQEGLWGWQPKGKLDIELCDGCRDATFYVVDREELQPDDALGIWLVEPATDRSPYR